VRSSSVSKKVEIPVTFHIFEGPEVPPSEASVSVSVPVAVLAFSSDGVGDLRLVAVAVVGI
jgi:hypothetical protein